MKSASGERSVWKALRMAAQRNGGKGREKVIRWRHRYMYLQDCLKAARRH